MDQQYGMENGLLNGIVLLDWRKAFHLVDTDVLYQSLYQCDELTTNWLNLTCMAENNVIYSKETFQKQTLLPMVCIKAVYWVPSYSLFL